jgi:hypothetical protein
LRSLSSRAIVASPAPFGSSGWLSPGFISSPEEHKKRFLYLRKHESTSGCGHQPSCSTAAARAAMLALSLVRG